MEEEVGKKRTDMVGADVFPVLVSADAEHGGTVCVGARPAWKSGGRIAGGSLGGLFFLFPLWLVARCRIAFAGR